MCRVRSTQGRDDYTQNSSMLERWAQRWSEKHPRALTPCFLLCCVIRTRLYDPLLNANSNNTSLIAVISVLFDLLIYFFEAPRGLISYVFICHHIFKFCEKSEFILVNIWGKKKKLFFYCLKSVMRGLGHCIPLSATFLCGLSFMWLQCLISWFLVLKTHDCTKRENLQSLILIVNYVNNTLFKSFFSSFSWWNGLERLESSYYDQILCVE